MSDFRDLLSGTAHARINERLAERQSAHLPPRTRHKTRRTLARGLHALADRLA
jgi:hypothetical protein